jgi:hypothetical protein
LQGDPYSFQGIHKGAKTVSEVYQTRMYGGDQVFGDKNLALRNYVYPQFTKTGTIVRYSFPFWRFPQAIAEMRR